MIVHESQQNHFIYFIHMLIDDKPIKLMYEEVKFKLTLDLIMLLCENLLLNLGFSDLLHSWEYKNSSNYDHNRLALVINISKGLNQ